MRSPRILVVDVGASHVACARFEVSANGRLGLKHFASAPLDADPSAELRAPDSLEQALRLVAASGKSSGPCALAIPGHLALTKFVKIPSLQKVRRAHTLVFEASEHIPYPLEEVVWSHVVIADDGVDAEIMFAAAKADAMQTLCAATTAAGFSVERATPAGVALVHAFRHNYPEVRASVLVVNIGARSTHLLFLENGRFYLRTVTLAGNTVTQAVADELQIGFAQAETLKTHVLSGLSDLPADSPSRVVVQRAAASFIGRLQLEITRSSVSHQRQSGTAAPSHVYVTGGGSLIDELPVALAEKLRLPVERYQPLRQVDLSPEARAAGAESSSARLADLVGLATRLANPTEQEPALLPPALTAALTFRKRQPIIVAAAALFAAALLPVIVYFDHRKTTTQRESALVENQLMPLRSLASRNAENLAKLAAAKTQIVALQDLVASKAHWIDFLGDLQTRLVKVEDVWLEDLRVLPSAADPLAGPTPADPAPPPPPLRLSLRGCLLDVANPDQKVSAASLARVKQLLGMFADSSFIASVENEHFDHHQPGLLRFDFTLVVNSKHPL